VRVHQLSDGIAAMLDPASAGKGSGMFAVNE
jgi:hypothetical protein